MRRIKLIIRYDGTAYHGWQRQKHEPTTVEEVLERALEKLLSAETDLQGASRTDAGVHAMGQVAHFDTENTIPAERIAVAVNGTLPEDIRVVRAEETADDFHARHDATGKKYLYRILTGSVADPLKRNMEHFHAGELDVEAMRIGAGMLIGTHDFSSFEKESDPERDSTREIFSVEVRSAGRRVEIEVKGNGFLYNMVRAIAGTLVEVGRGRREPGWVAEAIAARSRGAAGPTLLARGLVLLEVYY